MVDDFWVQKEWWRTLKFTLMKFLPKSVNGQGLAKSDFLCIMFHEHSLIKAQRAFTDEAKSVI